MSKNALVRSTEPASSPAQALYPLDWKTTEVRLGKGRFKHELQRPTSEDLIARDDSLQTEIPIAKDGSYSLPDPTATEDADAELYDKILAADPEGYDGLELSKYHKSTAVKAMLNREITVAEDADPLADEIAIVEEIGTGVEPEWVITHWIRQPQQSELESFRRKAAATSSIKPGKRGRQILVTRSNLRSLIKFYPAWLIRIDGASVDGKPWSEEDRQVFLAHVNPLVQRGVVQALVGAIDEALSD